MFLNLFKIISNNIFKDFILNLDKLYILKIEIESKFVLFWLFDKMLKRRCSDFFVYLRF